MQDESIHRDVEARTTAEADERDQAQVLREVLSVYPEMFTLEELIRATGGGSTEFAEQDRIERAVRDLVGAGLLHRREDDLVLPTRSAVRFSTLMDF